MPCRVDPSPYEIEQDRKLQEVKHILSWASKTFPGGRIWKPADDSYETISRLLCRNFRELQLTDTNGFESVIYNGRLRENRRAADWWDDHKISDAHNKAQTIKNARQRVSKRGKNHLALGVLVKLLDENMDPGNAAWYTVLDAIEELL